MKPKTKRKSQKRSPNANYQFTIWIVFLLSLLILIMWGCGTPEPNTVEIPQETVSETGTKPEPVVKSEPEPQTDPKSIEQQTSNPAEEPSPEPTETPTSKFESGATPVPTPAVNNNTDLKATASQLVWSGISNPGGIPIALTFDAGWEYSQTLQLLDVLDNNKVKATFFLRGGWVKDHPDLAQAISQRGHLLGNHSLSHGHMTSMSQEQMASDLAETTGIIQSTVGYTPYLFRPPYGEYNNALLNVLGEQGYRYTVMWTLDSHDWAETMNGVQVTEQYLIERVLKYASPNGIVLMHVGGYQTINALPEIISGLRGAGYNLVRLDELLPR